MRPLIPILLPLLVLAGCDMASPDKREAAAPAATPTPAKPETAGKVDRSHAGEAPPAAKFQDPAGKPATIAALARGKPLLVNLWATWCAPCVAEMPTLDALAVREAGRLGVVVIGEESAERVEPYFAKARFKALKPYRDPDLALSVAYAANLPTTILYGRDGKEVWRVTGPMDWTGDAAGALLAEAQ